MRATPAGPWHRQISFLAVGSLARARQRELAVDFGDFAENIATYYRAGDCIMPREGVFACVIQGGVVHCGDSVEVLK